MVRSICHDTCLQYGLLVGDAQLKKDTDEHPAWYFLARKLTASFISGKSCSFTNTTPGLSIKGNNYTKPYKL
jgi:hypothetical protein